MPPDSPWLTASEAAALPERRASDSCSVKSTRDDFAPLSWAGAAKFSSGANGAMPGSLTRRHALAAGTGGAREGDRLSPHRGASLPLVVEGIPDRSAALAGVPRCITCSPNSPTPRRMVPVGPHAVRRTRIGKPHSRSARVTMGASCCTVTLAARLTRFSPLWSSRHAICSPRRPRPRRSSRRIPTTTKAARTCMTSCATRRRTSDSGGPMASGKWLACGACSTDCLNSRARQRPTS